MTLSRLQIRLRWLMAAVAGVAVFLSLPTPVSYLMVLALFPATMILVPAALAPREHRIVAAYWAMALHPLAYVAWLAVWRLCVVTRPLTQGAEDWYYFLTLGLPYLLALLSIFYQPLLGACGLMIGQYDRPGRVLIPALALPVTWMATLAALIWDPFQVGVWFWD